MSADGGNTLTVSTTPKSQTVHGTMAMVDIWNDGETHIRAATIGEQFESQWLAIVIVLSWVTYRCARIGMPRR